MCFSPKMKVPKQDTAAIVPAAPPLAETATGVEFGGQSETDTEKDQKDTQGVAGATVKKTSGSTSGIKNAIKAKASTKK